MSTDAPATFEARVAAAVDAVPGWRGRRLQITLAAAPVASPVHRAVASDCVRIDGDGVGPLFAKIRHADMHADVLPQAAAAARRAAAIGVAPAVVLDHDGILASEFLDAPWTYATVGDLQALDVAAAALAAKKRLHASGCCGWVFSPFERIAALAAEATAAGVPMSDGIAPLMRAAALAGRAIAAAGTDLAFCHNDGIASNIMIGGEGVRLVDFDLAADNDPWFDVGAFLNEIAAFDDERRAAFEAYAGAYDERLFNRCRLYGVVDDLMWGLWGITRAITSPRTGIEFWKYGTWRLFRARTGVATRDFEMWLRRL